jgi:ADP-heptose:LPS heptosyltransferase
VNRSNIDVLINLSYSKSSEYLTSLINSKTKLGLTRSKLGRLAVEDTWSQYIFANVMNSPFNPYNLVDLFKKVLGVSYLPDPIEENETAKEKNVVIHPYASERKKKWGHSKWIEIVYNILKSHPEHTITVVGGKEDIQASEYIKNSKILESYQDRIKYWVGNRTIEELFFLLKESQLFIGHDSMVGHLAACADTQILTVSLGTVRPHETTPYKVGTINIAPKINCFPCTLTKKCDLLPCHGQVPYQLVSEITKMLIDNEDVNIESLKQKVSVFHLENVNVYRSYDPGHSEMELENISTDSIDTLGLFQVYYKILWSFILSDVELSSNFPALNKSTQKTVELYLDGLKALHDSYNFGKVFAQRIVDDSKDLKKNMPAIQESMKRIDEITKMSTGLKRNYPFLTPIIDYFYVVSSNAQGSNVTEIAKSSLLAFNNAQNATSVVYELLSQTLTANRSTSKPVTTDV